MTKENSTRQAGGGNFQTLGNNCYNFDNAGLWTAPRWML